MIAVDTDVLIAAHREDSPFHSAALAALGSLGGRRWAIPWPCVHEFLAITTHPRIFAPPTPLTTALAAIEGWLATPYLELLAEGAGHRNELSTLLAQARVVGPRVHDARIAALCLEHGVDELWTADRDFSRFTALRCLNPLVAP